jgi:hypothetical protein
MLAAVLTPRQSITATDHSLWSELAGSKSWSAPTLDLGEWGIL